MNQQVSAAWWGCVLPSLVEEWGQGPEMDTGVGWEVRARTLVAPEHEGRLQTGPLPAPSHSLPAWQPQARSRHGAQPGWAWLGEAWGTGPRRVQAVGTDHLFRDGSKFVSISLNHLGGQSNSLNSACTSLIISSITKWSGGGAGWAQVGPHGVRALT